MESQCLRTIKAHEPFKTLIDLNLNFTTETFIGLQIQLTETQSSHSFSNHNKVWKQKLKVTLRYGILESQNRVTKSSYAISLRYTSVISSSIFIEILLSSYLVEFVKYSISPLVADSMIQL